MKRNKETKSDLSRRDFIKTTAVGVGAAALTCLGPEQVKAVSPDQVPGWDYEADVVVVGFGGAGGAAALEAHDAGAKVLILEKTPTPGGSTTLCAGIFYAAGTSVQQAEGVTDTPDEMYNYWMAVGRGLNDPDMVRVLADHAAENLEWLKSMGAEFYSGVNGMGGIPPIRPLDQDAGWGLYYSGAENDPEYAAVTSPKVRGHVVRPVQPTWPYPPKNPTAPTAVGITRGTGFFKPLWEGAKARQIPVLLETRATALITLPDTNDVVGVKAESQGKTLYIRANRGVVLSAGGFTLNKDLAKYYCQEALYATNYTASDTGDGILMGMAIGAGTVNMDQSLLSLSVPQAAILVNTGGRRFVDETLYGMPAKVWRGQKDWRAYAIFDETIRSLTSTSAPIQAPTLAELAVKIGIDPDVLEDTVNFYNESVALGKDREFGKTRRRRHGDPPDQVPLPIKDPPFYAILRELSGTVSSQGITIGGLRINAKAQVLDASSKVIPRLYAAGRTTGGSMGKMYPGSGSSIADVITFGRIAGKNAATESFWKE